MSWPFAVARAPGYSESIPSFNPIPIHQSVVATNALSTNNSCRNGERIKMHYLQIKSYVLNCAGF